MGKIKNTVIVWSIDDFNTLGLMRELGQFELDVLFLIKGKAGFASKSKYCKKYIEAATIQDGFNYLVNSFKNCDYKPIIITSSDDIITFIDQHREELINDFIVPGCGIQGNSEKYTDKNTMTALAEEIGILCPKSKFVNWESDLTGIEYPCIIKPSHQRQGHYNEFKFKVCKNEKQLKRILRIVNHDSVFIVQQYIPKEKDLLVYGARMMDGKTVLAGAMIRDRMADSGSFSHGLMTSNIPQSVNQIAISTFLNRIDYYGPFSFEYGMVGNKSYFFEVNLRNDGTSHYFYQVGANIPLAYVYSCVGQDYEEVSTCITNDAWFIDEFFDYENVLKRVISKKQWKKDLSEATVYKYYDPNDLEPWKLVKKTRYKQMIQDIILKKFRLYIVFVLDKLGLKK